MAFKEKQVLKCFLFVWLSFIKVSGFVVFNEEKSIDSAGSFNKNARTRESSDRGEEKPKSGAQVGRLLIWQDQALKSHGGGSDSLSSDLSSRSQPDENAYQSDDSGWMKLQPLWGQVYGLNTEYTLPVERLLGMKPTVDCVGDLMKLTVHGREALFGSNFLIDRGSNPPLPLSQLPSECGHRFLRTWRDFVFIIPYDGCYVLQETNPVGVILNDVFDLPTLRMDPMTVIADLCKRDTFVLPLLWWGLPVKMSCSSLTSAKSLPTVSCYTNGMIVRLHGGVSENLKIKLMNEWQPLLKVSATCGYSLVSHPEGVVIHAPYLPCTEPKDGMFTLSMAIESEFNLSCPALSFNLPIDTPDRAPENERISIPHALTSTELPPTKITAKTTQPKRTPTGSSTTFKNPVKKIPAPPNPYYIPGQTDFNPVPPSNHFLLFAPKIPPTILPQGPEIVATPAAVTQRPQAPVYIKHPQTWYPKPSWDLTRDPTQQSATGSHYPSNPLFPPSNMVYPLYPGKPEVVAPSSAVFPQDPYWTHHSQTQQRPSEPHASPKLEYEPPTPPPTRKPGPQLFRHPWYKPFPPRHSEMPPVPTKVPQSNTVSTNEAVDSSSNIYSEEFEEAEKPQASVLPYHSALKGPPMNLHFHFTPHTYPTPSLPKVVHTPSPIKTLPIPVSSSHAHSFHCPTFCPGPPSVFYHHHNHHHFGYPFQMSNFDISSMTKITGQMLSSAVVSPGLTQFPLIQDMGYNYGPLYPKRTDVPSPSDVPAMQYLVENPLIKDTDAPDTSKHLAGSAMSPYIFRKLESPAASPQPTMKPANVAPVIHPLGPSKLHSRPLQNRPVTESLAYSEKSPNPAVNQAEMQRYFSPWDHDTQPLLGAPNNVPSFEKMVQHDVSSKPTVPPTHGKNVFMNYWYQAANPNARPPISDYPTKDSFTQMSLPQPFNNHNPSEPANELPQPEQTRESVAPVFRGPILFDTHWVPAVQTKKDVLFSGSQTDVHMKHPSTVD